MTVLPRGAKNRRGGGRPGWLLLTALLVLAILASTTLVFTNRVELLRLAVILSLWAAVLAAFVSVIYRRQSQLDAAKARDMKFVYDLQLDREISARREYELSVEAHLRRQLAVELRAQAADEMGALRAELATLRANLQALLGADLGDRPALESERVVDAPIAMPPAPGRVHSSRVTPVAEEYAAPAGASQVGGAAELTPDAESSIIDVPEEPLLPAPPPPPAAQPPASGPPTVPGRRQRPPFPDPRQASPPERDRGSHRRTEAHGSGPRPTPVSRPAQRPRPSAPPPSRPTDAVPPRPPIIARPAESPQISPTPWRPPETRTRPGRHRSFEEQIAQNRSPQTADSGVRSGSVASVPPGPMHYQPDPGAQHRSTGGRHANAASGDHDVETAGRHRNTETPAAPGQTTAEDSQGQHAGGAPVADLVARVRGGGPTSTQSGGGGRRRRGD